MSNAALLARARSLWPSEIPVRETDDTEDGIVALMSAPLLLSYPARLMLVVREGQRESAMVQGLPGCALRSWDFRDDEMKRALSRQWIGISRQRPLECEAPKGAVEAVADALRAAKR